LNTIVGAGSVGLALAARLAALGPVQLVTRRPEAAASLREGLHVEDPGTGARAILEVSALADWADAQAPGRDPVFVCTRLPDTDDVAGALALHAPEALAVSVQNGLDGGARLARRVPRVVCCVWRQTATRVGDAHVRFTGKGRVIVGAQRGCDTADDARRLAAQLEEAGLDASCSDRIERDQWLKVCINLMSAPNALVQREDHETHAFVEVKARLLEEARDALAAAGISAEPCDARDRTLDAEIAYQRATLGRGTAARRLPLYNHVWTALREGRSLEAGHYHERILDLAAAHGTRAPANARVREALLHAEAKGLGPESMAAADLLPPPDSPEGGPTRGAG
jgi:2-dehydropantoate 2-reductase